jgi:two-component system response regulator TctD
VRLKRREMMLLEIFITRPGQVFSKDELLDKLFGFDEHVNANAVELYVGLLRRRFEGASAQILTIKGFGYRLVPDDNS